MKNDFKNSSPGVSTTTRTTRRGFFHVSARYSISWHQILSYPGGLPGGRTAWISS